MKPPAKHWIKQTPWEDLRGFTAARIALGRAGASLPTDEVLQFGLAHAQARDAVHTPLNADELAESLRAEKFNVLQSESNASDRSIYLRRPDLGRQLHEKSRTMLQAAHISSDICIVVADGLSAYAVQSHVLPLLMKLRDQWVINWPAIPIIIATQARVALGDAVGETLNAKFVVVLIGERPGLSSPDSLGAYLTYMPKIGRTDAERNCISNIRPQGLNYPAAAKKIKWLTENSLQLKLSGVQLKDESDLIKIV